MPKVKFDRREEKILVDMSMFYGVFLTNIRSALDKIIKIQSEKQPGELIRTLKNIQEMLENPTEYQAINKITEQKEITVHEALLPAFYLMATLGLLLSTMPVRGGKLRTGRKKHPKRGVS